MYDNFSMLPPLLLFLFPLAYSPGPGNLFFAALGARHGLRATVLPTLGYHGATFAITLVAGLGAMRLSGADQPLDLWLKLAGSVYILHLAWKQATTGPQLSTTQARPMGLIGGALLLVLNPKAYAIIALIFSQFPVPGPAEAALISLIFTLNNMLAFFVWALVGEALSRLFRNPGAAVWLNRSLGGVLVAVAIWMLRA